MFRKTDVKVSSEKKFETEHFAFPDNISMKEIGNEISGIYQGLLVKPGEGLNGGDLILMGFTVEGTLTTCVAGSQMVSFVESFNTGYWLKVVRTGTRKLKDDRRFAIYEFDCNPLGFKEDNKIKFIDASELQPKQIQQKP